MKREKLRPEKQDLENKSREERGGIGRSVVVRTRIRDVFIAVFGFACMSEGSIGVDAGDGL